MKPDERDVAEVRGSALFDADWYRSRHPDVATLGMDPAEHYLLVGATLLRSPGPGFDTSHYLAANPDVLRSGMNPLLHYLRHGQAEGRACRPAAHARLESAPATAGLRTRAGARVRVEGRKSVLVCAHQVGAHAFGGERSLLDLLDGLAAIGCNAFVAAPPGAAADYRTDLLARSVELLEFPLPWWRRDADPDPSTMVRFAEIIRTRRIDAVHANTLVLREPLIAARKAGIPAIVHIRELVDHDPAICDAIGESAQAIRDQLLARADWIVANSCRTAEAFASDGRTLLVPNTVDEALFGLAPPAPAPGDRIRIALVSSNLPKKGLADFVAVARLLEVSTPRARFLLVGPDNRHVQALKAGAGNKPPSNLEFAGYRRSSRDAIAGSDVVVNLSHFQESFGRTLLEAMAGARAVVAYDWGALGELVVDGETGLLVPYGDIPAVAANLEWLCAVPQRIVELGRAGRARARSEYDRARFAARLRDAYDRIWASVADNSASTCGPNRADQLFSST